VRITKAESRVYAWSTGCADLGTFNDMASVSVPLKAPLGSRVVVRACDGLVLPVTGRDGPPR
jgi:hypothetical protein